MDVLYGNDRKLGDFDETDMAEILENDVFQNPTSMANDSYMDNDWFNSLFDDPVLNDKMITDAAQPPCIKSEHSYSLNDHNPSSPLGLAKIEDIETDFFGTHGCLDLSQKTSSMVKQESLDLDAFLTTANTTICTPSTVSDTKPRTIILATPSVSTVTTPATASSPDYSDHTAFSNIIIKQEPADIDDNAEQTVSVDSCSMMPPTPPSSSDSDGCSSPSRSAPSSPIRQSSLRTQQAQQQHSFSSLSPKTVSPPLFVSPIPQSGVLVLTEEEKRTLIAEGYPIPQKLPLTKQEEKNLKKIRRKIKNKISAQESRRKKKEYVEALEKRVEAYSQENTDLKKRVDSLENNNRSLIGQLQKLQSIVSKITRPSAASATQTGTVLMVLVLCFAVFLGSWSPTSLNIGYSSSTRSMDTIFPKPAIVRPAPSIGPHVEKATVDDYITPNKKSRVLLSLKDDLDEEDDFGPIIPWTRVATCSPNAQPSPAKTQTERPSVRPAADDTPSEEKDTIQELPLKTIATIMERANETDAIQNDFQATMHPDIAVSPTDFVSFERRGNISADIETA